MNSKANVLIDMDGHARLANFGLAYMVLGKEGSTTKEGDVSALAMVAVEVRTRRGSERSFSADSPRTDIYRPFHVCRMLQCCVVWGASYTASSVE
jgi:hypothetical protein